MFRRAPIMASRGLRPRLLAYCRTCVPPKSNCTPSEEVRTHDHLRSVGHPITPETWECMDRKDSSFCTTSPGCQITAIIDNDHREPMARGCPHRKVHTGRSVLESSPALADLSSNRVAWRFHKDFFLKVGRSGSSVSDPCLRLC